jgi:hypothetical protein
VLPSVAASVWLAEQLRQCRVPAQRAGCLRPGPLIVRLSVRLSVKPSVKPSARVRRLPAPQRCLGRMCKQPQPCGGLLLQWIVLVWHCRPRGGYGRVSELLQTMSQWISPFRWLDPRCASPGPRRFAQACMAAGSGAPICTRVCARVWARASNGAPQAAPYKLGCKRWVRALGVSLGLIAGPDCSKRHRPAVFCDAFGVCAHDLSYAAARQAPRLCRPRQT